MSPGLPVNVGKVPGRDPARIQLSFNIRSVSEIDEVKFEFQATADVVMHWSDQNIWAECVASGEENIDKGKCQYVWRPKLLFPNARELDMPPDQQYLWQGVVL